jgi:hypothetical protein
MLVSFPREVPNYIQSSIAAKNYLEKLATNTVAALDLRRFSRRVAPLLKSPIRHPNSPDHYPAPNTFFNQDNHISKLNRYPIAPISRRRTPASPTSLSQYLNLPSRFFPQY